MQESLAIIFMFCLIFGKVGLIKTFLLKLIKYYILQ